MNLSSVLSLLLVLFLSLSESSVNFRVSHQASAFYSYPVDVRVGDEPIPEFNNTAFAQTSEFVGFEDDDDLWVTVYVSGTNILLLNATPIFTTDGRDTFFIVQEPDTSGVDYILLPNERVQVNQYYSNFRIINLATTNETVDIAIDGQLTFSELEYSETTPQSAIVSGIHLFEILNQTLDQYTLTSGVDYTFVVNFIGGTDLYQLIELVDNVFEFSNCQYRVINAVPDDEPITIQVDDLMVGVAYSQISDYEDLDIGEYEVVFRNSTDILTTTSFICESSGRYSVALVGAPSLGQPYRGVIIEDSTYSPLYLETTVRVVHFSPSPSASPAGIFLDDFDEGYIEYPNASLYFSTPNEVVKIQVVASDLVLVNDTFNLELGSTFSLFLFGLVDERRNSEYPLSYQLVTDFKPELTTTTSTSTSSTSTSTSGTSTSGTTTTRTTTSSSTGRTSTTGTQDDDDDDDGLSGGEIAGIVIGVLVGVILFGGLCFYILKRRAHSQQDTAYAQFEKN